MNIPDKNWRAGGFARDLRSNSCTVICKKSIIYGRHRGGKWPILMAASWPVLRLHSPRCVLTERIGDPNLSGTPAATCHLHVLARPHALPLGKILQNFQGHARPAYNSPRASSSSLIRLRISRVPPPRSEPPLEFPWPLDMEFYVSRVNKIISDIFVLVDFYPRFSFATVRSTNVLQFQGDGETFATPIRVSLECSYSSVSENGIGITSMLLAMVHPR